MKDTRLLILTKSMALRWFADISLEEIQPVHFPTEFRQILMYSDITIVLDGEYFLFLKNKFSAEQRVVRESCKLGEELYPYGIEIG